MAEAPAAAIAVREAAMRRFGAEALVKSPYFAENGVWARDIGASPSLASAGSFARVFYLPKCVPRAEVAKYLTNTPAVAVNGDRYIMLQNGSLTGSPTVQLPGLLSWEDRRRSRKKAIISLEKAYATGGYRAPLVAFPKPRWAVVVSVAGPQFEVDYLESACFIAMPPTEYWDKAKGKSVSSEDADSGAPKAIFPHYYPAHPALPFSGRKPTWAEAHAFATGADPAAADPHLRSLVDIVPIPWSASDDDEGRPAYLLGGAYTRAAGEDMWTALAGFEEWMREQTDRQANLKAAGSGAGDAADAASAAAAGAGAVAPKPDSLPRLSPRGWLQLPMIGLGFFAQWMGRRNIAPLLMPRLLDGLRWALEQGPPAHTSDSADAANPTGAAGAAAVGGAGAGELDAAATAAADPLGSSGAPLSGSVSGRARAPWRHLSVLELCDFSATKTFTLAPPGSREGQEALVGGVRVLHSVRRGLLDFTGLDADPASVSAAAAAMAGTKSADGAGAAGGVSAGGDAAAELELEAAPVGAFTPGVVNAGDCFAFPGNERGYGSVEAMLGENTSLRRNQVYLYNPWLLHEGNHVTLTSPLA